MQHLLSGPTRSTTERLGDKRYALAGDRAYVMGTADGGFAPLGTQITGEMGGVWAHPIKLLTGYWFALDGEWLPPARRFTSGTGYIQIELPQFDGLDITRLEFSPDGLPELLVALTLRNGGDQPRRCVVSMQERSQLMAAYSRTTTPTAEALNTHDEARYDLHAGTLVVTRPDKPWCAIIGASLPASSGAAGDQYWGPLAEADRVDYSQRNFSTGGKLGWELDHGPLTTAA
jgi:hypothetical protein